MWGEVKNSQVMLSKGLLMKFLQFWKFGQGREEEGKEERGLVCRFREGGKTCPEEENKRL